MSDRATLLSAYRFPVIAIDCARCSRHTEPHVAMLKRKFGDVTVGEAARLVAAAGGCALAQAGAVESICGVRVLTPPVERWACLDHARLRGWAALLHCGRHLEALKRTKPCHGAVELDVLTMIGVLGHNFPLDKLPARLVCPSCGTKSVRVEWIMPASPPAPGGTSGDPEPVRLQPTKAALGRTKLRVISGKD